MEKLIRYIKQHINQTRQESLLLLTITYGQSARKLWATLGYQSACEFDKAFCQAKLASIERDYKRHKQIHKV